MTIRVIVNGVGCELAAGATLADALAAATGSATPGVAVALNDEVVPRRAWPDTAVDDGDRVEVVTAIQGG